MIFHERLAAGTLIWGTMFAALAATAVRAGDVSPKLSAADLKYGTWPQWRGPNRDGRSADKGLMKNWDTPPLLAWSVQGLGAGYASVSIADGRIFTVGNFDDGQSVVARNAENGQELWRQSLTDKPPKHQYEGARCTPSIDGDRLFVVTSDGQIACLKSTDGTVVWKKSFKKEWDGSMMSGWGFSESPLVDGPWVLCTPGGDKAMIVALQKETGEEVWRCAAGEFTGARGKKNGAGYSSIVISEGAGVKQYLQLVGQGLMSARANDGKFLWGYGAIANSTANIPTPIVKGDLVFCSTGYQTGSALLRLAKEGAGVRADEVYFLNGKALQNHHGGMVAVGDHVYLGHGHKQGYPTCVNLESGKIVWGGDARGPGKGSAAVTYADGHLVFRYESGEVALIEATPAEYRLKGVFKPEFVHEPSWAHPVIVGGRLYLRDQDWLMCYKVTE